VTDVTSGHVTSGCSPANDNLSVPITTEAAFTIALLGYYCTNFIIEQPYCYPV
jgi:hypothetical protein